MKNIKSIGVLGGMGPAASAHFYKLLVHHSQVNYGAVQDNTFPKIVLYSLPLEGFNETGVIDSSLVEQQILDAAIVLENTGVDIIVMTCNTAHAYVDSLNKVLSIPLLNIISTTASEASRFGLKTVGILSSSSTRELALYELVLDLHGISTLHVDLIQQKQIDAIILRVMGGTVTRHDAMNLQKISESLIKKGAEGIILGCTELPLVTETIEFPLPLINSMQSLVRSTLEFAYESNEAEDFC